MEPLTLFLIMGAAYGETDHPSCYSAPDCHYVGTLEVGVRKGPIELFAHHSSFTQAEDAGSNTVGVRYRAEWTIGGF